VVCVKNIKQKVIIDKIINVRILTSIVFMCLLIACTENKVSRLDFMIGTWKIEGKDQYEVWEKAKNNDLIGYSYMISNNEKRITETLSIKTINSQIFYEATVPDQNDGKTIQFPLNNKIKAYLSFENIEHDFPQKIQYKRINDNEIEVTVSGDKGKGFSYTQLKQTSK